MLRSFRFAELKTCSCPLENTMIKQELPRLLFTYHAQWVNYAVSRFHSSYCARASKCVRPNAISMYRSDKII